MLLIGKMWGCFDRRRDPDGAAVTTLLSAIYPLVATPTQSTPALPRAVLLLVFGSGVVQESMAGTGWPRSAAALGCYHGRVIGVGCAW